MNELSVSRFKKCAKCRCLKPAENAFFYADKTIRDGLRGSCIACLAKYGKQYYAENKEACSEYGKRYWAANKEAMHQWTKRYRAENREARAAYGKQYYAENKEACAERNKRWKEANREAESERTRRWAKANPEKIRAGNRKRRALKRNAEHEPYTDKDLNGMWHEQGGCCLYCDIPLFGNYNIEHMTPLSRGGADKLRNLCLSCPTCNSRKGTKTASEFMEEK